MTYEDFQARVHPEDRAMRDNAIKMAIATKGTYELEYRILLPDGTIRWISGRARCIGDEKGELSRLLGVSIDVTKRKQAEELFRLATEASPIGILLLNEEGKIVLVNAHIEELFGYERDELVGQSIGLLLPERFAAEYSTHQPTVHRGAAARQQTGARSYSAGAKTGLTFLSRLVSIRLKPHKVFSSSLLLWTFRRAKPRKKKLVNAASRSISLAGLACSVK